jgi:hypothetical protein
MPRNSRYWPCSASAAGSTLHVLRVSPECWIVREPAGGGTAWRTVAVSASFELAREAYWRLRGEQ